MLRRGFFGRLLGLAAAPVAAAAKDAPSGKNKMAKYPNRSGPCTVCGSHLCFYETKYTSPVGPFCLKHRSPTMPNREWFSRYGYYSDN